MKIIDKFHNAKYPRIKQVNGLLNLGVLSFGWFNLVLGASLFFQASSTNEFFIINEVFTYQFWGIVFFIGGISLLVGHLLNYWTWMRWTILGLLFTKFIWLTALISRQFTDPGSNTFLILFFGLITFLQIGGYLYFPVYRRLETWKG